MSGSVRPVPQNATFINGMMYFEQLVTVEFEDRSLVPPSSVHVQHAKQVAARNGYRFSGESKIDRIRTTDPGIMLYRLTVPVCGESG